MKSRMTRYWDIKNTAPQSSYQPKNIQEIRAGVADGNARVLPKCGRAVEVAPKRSSAHRKTKDGPKRDRWPFWGGWFFPQCPKTGRILYTSPMYRPENNSFALDGIEKAVTKYQYPNCFIYDRACKLKENVAVGKKNFRNVSTYTADKFHGSRHKSKCIANPHSHNALTKRIVSLNTIIAGATFPFPR